MNIVFSVNKLGLEGLAATLVSLLRHCSKPNAVTFYFFCSDLGEADKANVKNLLASQSFAHTVHFIDFDAKKMFGHLKSLHGDWTTYGRLLIPKHVNGEAALYLDSDLVVEVDVLELADFDTGEHFLGAVASGKMVYTLERDFFINRLKIPGDTPYFNAGVLLFNLKQWRLQKVEDSVNALTEKYPQEFLAVDQTLLNAICSGRFARLPEKFNNAWYPANATADSPEKSILHFVGSPKPWDVSGRLTHSGYRVWKSYDDRRWRSVYGSLSAEKLMRTWKTRKSIAKKLVHKFFR